MRAKAKAKTARPQRGTSPKTKAQAAKWLERVAIALRYGPHKSLPIASMYAAVGDQRRATELANQLIADGSAVEIMCIADRVALAHASIVPALLALRRRGGALDHTGAAVEMLGLSETARAVLAFVASEARPTAGDVRRHFGASGWPNPYDDALAELQRALVLDRGPTDVPERGAAYLTKEGIPYRLVDEAHPQHVRAAKKLQPARAAELVVGRFVVGAPDATRKHLAKIFGQLLSPDELDTALATHDHR